MIYQLIAAPLSLYSGKARGYMRWKNIPFREVLSSRDVYANVILPRVGYPIIPVMITPDDTTIQDTTDIIDYIEANEAGPSVYPEGPCQKLAALIMEVFGDEWLLMAAMHYRWKYNKEFAWQEFGKISRPDLSSEEQFETGKKTATKFMGMLPALGITEKTMPAIESSYEKFLDAFNTHLGHHEFLLGSRPSIGDYGLLGPLYAHNYRDPASGEMMEKLAPAVVDWCLHTHAPQHALEGDFVADDGIPVTLIPLLEMFADEHLPILLDTAKHLSAWAADKSSGEFVPRALGMHAFTIDGVEDNRAILPFGLWMLQRVSDHLNSLDGTDKSSAHALLDTIGARALIDMDVPRLARINFKLALA